MREITVTFEVSIRRSDWKGRKVERKLNLDIPADFISKLPMNDLAIATLSEAIKEWQAGEPIPEVEEREGESE